MTPNAKRLAVLGLSLSVTAGCVFELAELADPATGGAGGNGGTGGTSTGTGGNGGAPGAYRMRLGVMAPSASMTPVEIPIVLTPERFPYDDAAADGSDIRVTDASGTPLPHELEAWTPGGTSLVWVRLEAVTPGEELELFFGDASSAGGEDPAAVWQDYVGVWHLADDPTGSTALDSSPGEHHGTIANLAADAQVDTALGPGFLFGGPNTQQAIDAGGSDAFDMDTTDAQLTLEVWYQWSGNQGSWIAGKEDCCVGWGVAFLGDGQLRHQYRSGHCCMVFGMIDPNANYEWGQDFLPSPLQATDFSHGVFEYDRVAGTLQAHINDTFVAGNAIDVAPGNGPYSGEFRIGGRFNGEAFDGLIAEIRVSRRTYAPIKRTLHHLAGLDQLLDYGTPQPVD